MNKKFIQIAVVVLFLAILGTAGYFIWRSVNGANDRGVKNNLNLSDGGGAIDQYRSQLTDLKEKAEKSGSVEDLQNFGIAQYATGDYAGAEATYRKQIEKDPVSVVAHSGLANALRDQKKFEQAVAEYKKVIELSPDNVSAYVNLASVYQYSLKQMDKALEVYGQGIDNNPDSADLQVLLGIADEQAGDIAGAKKAYAKALELQPENQAAKAAVDRLK